jgi:hypothetical protein
MLAKAHKSLIKVSCRAEILKHSQTHPSKEVEQALSSHLLECNQVRYSSSFQNGNAVRNSSQAVQLSWRPSVGHHQICIPNRTQITRTPHCCPSSRQAAGLLRHSARPHSHSRDRTNEDQVTRLVKLLPQPLKRSCFRNWGGEPDAGGKLWLVLRESFQWHVVNALFPVFTSSAFLFLWKVLPNCPGAGGGAGREHQRWITVCCLE